MATVGMVMEQGDEGRTQDLRAFKALKAALPATKIGAVVALLPEIRHLQRQGHKTRAIWESLQRDGIDMSYELFRVYLGRARRRLERNDPRLATGVAQEQTAASAVGQTPPEGTRLASDGRPTDPFAAIRQGRGQKVKERFDYDPLTPLKEDLLR
jgi:hypothetical protein